ncbi:hypothetical protein DICPUDRAFT_153164 [Dictyostelium purpureum]|uniref:Profilin n=1 Tax=Dictyostelium purpureum TaxID=5786 RepID=F0ZN74_DICPU|nr:uncharacterized protein DICPUDRAFT_153164 [Dictyostelium purpureum]EGC34601.1 hypothetical protein DICPUDRAFT_153164 [Dictyostelium purpureum]|eukprot:XP_003288878.1 hypothetical protein DICPUDRAFT_153164 [Dictyostelium purpureum]
MVAINEAFIKTNILDQNVNYIDACIIGAPEKICLGKSNNFQISNEEVKKVTEVFTLFRDAPIVIGGKSYTRTKSTASYIIAKHDTTGIALFQNNMGLIAIARYLDGTIEQENILKTLQHTILKALA